MLFLGTAIVGCMVELVFLPYDLNASSGQDVFHGGVVELSEFLVELAIREESLFKGVDCSFLVRNGSL